MENKEGLWTKERYRLTPYVRPKKEKRSLMDVVLRLMGYKFHPKCDPEVEQTIRLLQRVGEHERCVRLAKALNKARQDIENSKKMKDDLV